MTGPQIPGQYTADRLGLWQATLGALGVAIVLFVVAVLPAEFGIDPTGIGEPLGLIELYEGGQAGGVSLEERIDPVRTYDAGPSSITETIHLPPGEGIEYKVRMQEGEVLLYMWGAEAVVRFDLHGEPAGGAADLVSYLVDIRSGDRGSLAAPFTGTHGWFFENQGTGPVSIELTLEGYFEPLGPTRPSR